ncbi:MAG TPA: HD domain-containing protein [bacterium]
MSTLAHAIHIAVQAHEGQLDRYGSPYILHPLRVLSQMHTEDEKVAAVLHDVIEDSDWTLEALSNEGFSTVVLKTVDDLTRRQDEDYMDYIERLKPNPIARRVKLADLEDNMDLRRLKTLSEKDIDRLVRYHQVWIMLKTVEESRGRKKG